jgi:formyltetrahydrofolate deformylase
VSAVSTFLYERGANIIASDQHSTDPQGGTFAMRMEFDLGSTTLDALLADFDRLVAGRFAMDYRVGVAGRPKRVAILVSRETHCLLDLLWRSRQGELEATIAMVVSNHEDARADVEALGVPFAHVPVEPGHKQEAEETIMELLGEETDLVVLARYMQILTGDFLAQVGAPIINIHHSFLPAFVGANPYGRAFERGVKIVGATAHYVTEELDAGPIIEQDVQRVSHRHGVADLERIGRDVERLVLARAVAAHLQDRVTVHGSRTFVFA